MATWTLNKICSLINKPEVLNALHACRPGHPLNKLTERPWSNAYFLCQQQPSFVIPSDALDWIAHQAIAESQL